MRLKLFLAVVVLAAFAWPAPPQDRAPGLSDLPLVEVPAPNGPSDLLAVLITGDGGWAATDKGLAKDLSEAGIPVVGLNSLQYFWSPKTPERAAADLGRILTHYLEAWRRTKAVLIGYSFGADVLPFMMNRLPEDLQARVGTLVLLSASASAEFEFHLSDWLGGGSGKNARPTVPEIQRLRPEVVLLCVYGADDKQQICGQLDPRRVRSVAIPGGHKVRGRYGPVAEAILESLKPR